MALIRILIIALVVWLLLRMIKNWASRPAGVQKDTRPEVESMVRCQHCGLHIPKQEAIRSDNYYYCSQEHLQLHQKEP